MSKDDQNPYESPALIRETPIPDLRWSLRTTIAVLLVGLILTAIAPVVGVIATLICVPAVLRASRVVWRMKRAGESLSWLDLLGIGLLSLFVVLPVAIAAGAAFCCVCVPVGFVGFSIAPNDTVLTGFVYAGVYIGLAAGLSLSAKLLRKFY